jgi:exonuclease III
MEIVNHYIGQWNCRGLNGAARKSAVRAAADDANAAIICLVETKLQVVTRFTVSQVLGPRYDEFTFLPADGTAGGILVAWQSALVSVSATRVDKFCLSVQLNFVDGHSWWHTTVYGPTVEEQKEEFLEELQAIRTACPGMWVAAGDFNLILDAADKNNDRLNRRMMARFRQVINRLELVESPLTGRRYTWSSERIQPTLTRIDRWFSSSDWDSAHPNSLLHALSSNISDHCPIMMATNVNFSSRRRFHFEAFWPGLTGFQEVVSEAWMAPAANADAFTVFDKKLRATARALRSWSSRKIGTIKEQLLMAQEIIFRLDAAQDERPLGPEEFWLRKELKKKILGLSSLQRTIARQRSRLLWIREGDANTSFFHSHANRRKKKNHMFRLRRGTMEVNSQEEMEELASDFYVELLGTPQSRDADINLAVLDLPSLDLNGLEGDLSEEEMWSVIKQLPADKAPGPDGFSARFYQTCWNTIKGDFMAAINQLSSGDTRNFSLLNQAYITLLPKKEGAVDIAEFRPISLIHGFAKIVAKALACRLSPHMDSLIAVNQSAFIRGRSIQDNFMLVSQSAKTFHRRKVPALFLKLDIARAFDSVSWPLLLLVLRRRGFGPRFCRLITILLQTASTCVLINGSPGKRICDRGTPYPRSYSYTSWKF